MGYFAPKLVLTRSYGAGVFLVSRWGDAGCLSTASGSRFHVWPGTAPTGITLVYLSRWTDTLMADGQTIYDPKLSADRMVLGIGGQVSEMELDYAVQGLVDARWNKAGRGGLMTIPLAGYDVDDLNQLVKTSAESVAQAIETVFSKFDELEGLEASRSSIYNSSAF